MVTYNEIDGMYVDWYLENPQKYQDLEESHKKSVDESFDRLFAPVEVPSELEEILTILD